MHISALCQIWRKKNVMLTIPQWFCVGLLFCRWQNGSSAVNKFDHERSPLSFYACSLAAKMFTIKVQHLHNSCDFCRPFGTHFATCESYGRADSFVFFLFALLRVLQGMRLAFGSR